MGQIWSVAALKRWIFDIAEFCHLEREYVRLSGLNKEVQAVLQVQYYI